MGCHHPSAPVNWALCPRPSDAYSVVPFNRTSAVVGDLNTMALMMMDTTMPHLSTVGTYSSTQGKPLIFWSKQCAFVAISIKVAVVDLGIPTSPRKLAVTALPVKRMGWRFLAAQRGGPPIHDTRLKVIYWAIERQSDHHDEGNYG